MVVVKDFDAVLKHLAKEYLIAQVTYVGDLKKWSAQATISLSEPDQFMKLITEGRDLSMVVQSPLPDSALENLVRALGVRWSRINNVASPEQQLNTEKKRLAYCFLKEYARSVPDVAGDELKEDEWALRSMEKLGFFRE